MCVGWSVEWYSTASLDDRTGEAGGAGGWASVKVAWQHAWPQYSVARACAVDVEQLTYFVFVFYNLVFWGRQRGC